MWYKILKLDAEDKNQTLKIQLEIKTPIKGVYGTVDVKDNIVEFGNNDEIYVITDKLLFRVSFIKGKIISKTYPVKNKEAKTNKKVANLHSAQ